MVERLSALATHYRPGTYGATDQRCVTIELNRSLSLMQVAAWSSTRDAVASKLATALGVEQLSTDRATATFGKQSAVLPVVLPVEPLKWWLLDLQAPVMPDSDGMILDISHARTHLTLSGEASTELLGRHLPLDLRLDTCPVGSVASTAFHHCGVTLLRRADAFDLFLPRSFAVSLFELLCRSADQFGLEIR